MRIAFDQLMDALIIDVAPVFSLFTSEAITEGRGVRFKGGHYELGVSHHFESLVDTRKLRMQDKRRPASERQRLLSVPFDQFDAEMLAVFFGFFQQALGNIVMMNVNGRGSHGGPHSESALTPALSQRER